MVHTSYTADALWKLLQAGDTNGDVMTAGTRNAPAGSSDYKMANGIAY